MSGTRRPGESSENHGGYSAEILGFSEASFTLLRDLISQRAGVYFGDEKRDLLADKLSDLMAARGMSSYLDYYYLLRYDAESDRYWAELMDQLAVPETFFWRQHEQLLALSQVVAPAHFARKPGATLRIWSAACCSGEEPVSIAIALAEAGLLYDRPVEIVASDASAALLELARRGTYRERSFRQLPVALREKYFTAGEGGWQVDPRLHARIRWVRANLVSREDVLPLARADVIFCRNVFIYFADETVARTARMFAEAMPADGVLFLGASESLTRLETDFELREIGAAFAYVRSAGALPSAGQSAGVTLQGNT
jgi:chemotaxis protein methyltransferase CheR